MRQYEPGTKLIVCHAPPGVVEHGGPSVFIDNGEVGEYSLEGIAKKYEERGYEITYGVVTEKEA